MTLRSWQAELHHILDGLDRRFGWLPRATSATEAAWIRLLDAVVARQSDRLYMARQILPALARARPRRILFVGVRRYTRDYAAAFRGQKVEFWTADIDPEAAEHGSRSRHVTEDLRAIDAAFPPAFFDVVMINGVFGWGVDGSEDIARALAATAEVLEPDGLLLIGWNRDRVADPDGMPGIDLFEPVGFAGLPHRKDFPDVTHVYAWYRKSAQGGSDATTASG